MKVIALTLTTAIAVAAGVNPVPPAACALDYNPVCALSHGIKKNYSNICLAEQSGATGITPGLCERTHRRKHKK